MSDRDRSPHTDMQHFLAHETMTYFHLWMDEKNSCVSEEMDRLDLPAGSGEQAAVHFIEVG